MNIVRIPIEIRNGIVVWVELPSDITHTEAMKVGRIVMAYATKEG